MWGTLTLAESLVLFLGVLAAEADAGAAGGAVGVAFSSGERARLRFLRDPLRFLECYNNNNVI